MIEVFLFGIVLGLIPITLAGLFYPQIQVIPTLIDLPTTAHNEERINSCATSLFQINFLVISCFWSHIIKEGKDYYSLDLGQDYSYARDRILRDMTKISPF
ncbi:hypothetical protein ACJX0J_001861 [Zea mays]